MLGGVFMVVAMLVLLPLSFIVVGGLTAAMLGESLWRDGADRAEPR